MKLVLNLQGTFLRFDVGKLNLNILQMLWQSKKDARGCIQMSKIQKLQKMCTSCHQGSLDTGLDEARSQPPEYLSQVWRRKIEA